MKQLGNVVAWMLLAVNFVVTMLLVGVAYSPAIDPTEHSIRSLTGLTFPLFLLLNGCFQLFWLVARRYRSALLPLVGFLLCRSQIGLYCPINFGDDEAPKEGIKLLSYNVMGFDNGKKKDGKNEILAYLKESGADIICLQEYTVGIAKNRLTQREVERALKEYPYRKINRLGSRKGSRNQMACYSKYPILSARTLKYESRHNGSVLYEIKIGNDTLALINNHLESNKLTRADREAYTDMLTAPEESKIKDGTRMLVRKLAEATKLRAPQADAVAQAIEESPHASIIVCGDFNDTPISYAHHTISKGLNDAFAEAGCGLGISYHRNGFYFRIDHVLTSKNLKIYQCEVDRSIRASDHYPISCLIGKEEKRE